MPCKFKMLKLTASIFPQNEEITCTIFIAIIFK